MNATPRELLASGADEMGITLSDSQLDQFDVYTSMLLEWNQKFNLTRITDPQEIVIKHYLDSLSVLSFMDMTGKVSLIDIGTGAGFPGIPLKIVCPDMKVILLDSMRKRLSFLEAVSQELGLSDVATLHARAEDAAKDKVHRDKYDFAVSRAVARLNTLVELCLPFCRVGGRFISYKGPESGPEIEESAGAVRLLGGVKEKVGQLMLPHSDIQRTLIVIKKIRPAPSGYPRQAGLPEREPIV
ncbi:MAG: 16S rRNA (guanine(527)-N(7))-methyltransferase RsmG [Armatimonadota bacterium]